MPCCQVDHYAAGTDNSQASYARSRSSATWHFLRFLGEGVRRL